MAPEETSPVFSNSLHPTTQIHTNTSTPYTKSLPTPKRILREAMPTINTRKKFNQCKSIDIPQKCHYSTANQHLLHEDTSKSKSTHFLPSSH